MKMIQYDSYGGYIRADKIAWVYNRRNGGVVIISEDGKESQGNFTAAKVIQQMSQESTGGT